MDNLKAEMQRNGLTVKDFPVCEWNTCFILPRAARAHERRNR